MLAPPGHAPFRHVLVRHVRQYRTCSADMCMTIRSTQSLDGALAQACTRSSVVGPLRRLTHLPYRLHSKLRGIVPVMLPSGPVAPSDVARSQSRSHEDMWRSPCVWHAPWHALKTSGQPARETVVGVSYWDRLPLCVPHPTQPAARPSLRAALPRPLNASQSPQKLDVRLVHSVSPPPPPSPAPAPPSAPPPPPASRRRISPAVEIRAVRGDVARGPATVADGLPRLHRRFLQNTHNRSPRVSPANAWPGKAAAN